MSIEIKNVSIVLRKNAIQKSNKTLLHRFNLKLGARELLMIKGASGCGKSTLLSLLAGVLDNNVFSVSGQIFLDGNDARKLTIAERRVGMLTQDHLLFPHFTVEENLAFVMPSGVSAAGKKMKILPALRNAGLQDLLLRKPYSLSGGERARIAMLAVLMRQPQYVLLDEPFSKLDDKRRESFRTFVFDSLADANLPVVMVTHDLTDIVSLRENVARNRQKKLHILETSWSDAGVLQVL